MGKRKVKSARVKIALLQKSLSQTELAKSLGLTLSQVNMVINGRRRTRWIQRAIASELRIPLNDLFPEEEHHP